MLAASMLAASDSPIMCCLGSFPRAPDITGDFFVPLTLESEGSVYVVREENVF